MSIGAWILTAFSLFGGLTAGLQFLADRRPRWRWPRRAARAASLPTALAGAGMSTYTAALLSATSTPLWAAAPRALGARFGASSTASGAAALSLSEPPGSTRSALDTIMAAALAAELLPDAAQSASYRRAGVAGAMSGGWGKAERIGATGLGTALPLGLCGLTAVTRDRGRLTRLAALATLSGSLLLRVLMMAAGDTSARTPETRFRFAQPDNLAQNGSRRSR